MADMGDGQRVRLRPIDGEGLTTEWGTVVGEHDVTDGTYLVSLDPACLDGAGDDGLREVRHDDITPCEGKMLLVLGDRCQCEPCLALEGRFTLPGDGS